MGRQYEHFGCGQDCENLAGGLQTIEHGHADIHQNHSWPQLYAHIDRLLTVPRFTDYLENSLLCQELP